MRTSDDLDRMHEAVVARFPGGITPEQFKVVTLESVDDDGRVYPHRISDFFVRQSMLMSMWYYDGLIEPGWRGYNEPMWWKITDKGRKWLAEKSVTADKEQ